MLAESLMINIERHFFICIQNVVLLAQLMQTIVIPLLLYKLTSF